MYVVPCKPHLHPLPVGVHHCGFSIPWDLLLQRLACAALALAPIHSCKCLAHMGAKGLTVNDPNNPPSHVPVLTQPTEGVPTSKPPPPPPPPLPLCKERSVQTKLGTVHNRHCFGRCLCKGFGGAGLGWIGCMQQKWILFCGESFSERLGTSWGRGPRPPPPFR